VASGAAPRCEACGGILKPDVVLFGEALPRSAVRRAESLFATADLVLVVGSSLEVYPAAALPLPALRAGARMIIVNQETTNLDGQADVVLAGDAADILPALADEVLGGRA
jgi:NAD-dependent deacetylase